MSSHIRLSDPSASTSLVGYPTSPHVVSTPSTSPCTTIVSLHHKINTCSRTFFEKRVWHALLQIPRGSYTTYGILASFLHSSPRAVGNALRRNPFAPEVPCHRVVATGRGIGGFKGRKGEGEKEIGEKRGLLRREGVRFHGGGRALGSPFEGFVKDGYEKGR